MSLVLLLVLDHWYIVLTHFTPAREREPSARPAASGRSRRLVAHEAHRDDGAAKSRLEVHEARPRQVPDGHVVGGPCEGTAADGLHEGEAPPRPTQRAVGPRSDLIRHDAAVLGAADSVFVSPSNATPVTALECGSCSARPGHVFGCLGSVGERAWPGCVFGVFGGVASHPWCPCVCMRVSMRVCARSRVHSVCDMVCNMRVCPCVCGSNSITRSHARSTRWAHLTLQACGCPRSRAPSPPWRG